MWRMTWQALSIRPYAAEKTVLADLTACQGQPVDLGGYFLPDPVKCAAAMVGTDG